ncbi:ABC transporter permease [Streptosporangium sp. NPDC004631]
MIRAVLVRLLTTAGLLVVVSVGTFILVKLAPQRPEQFILGPDAPPSAVAALHRELGLGDPWLSQFFTWFKNAVIGDLGTSWVSGRSVSSTIATAAVPTMTILVLSLVWCVLASLAVGLFSTLNHGGVVDRVLSALSAVLHGTPGFWLGILLVTVFALNFGLFPATGFVSPAESLTGAFQSTLLPSLALGLSSASVVGRFLRASMIGELGKEYVRSAIGQGHSRWYVLRHHALRNALGPAITQVGFQVVVMLSTAVVIERVFGIPGLGSLAVTAAAQNDPPTLMGTVVTFALIVLVVNIVVDLLYSWANPKLRSA